MTTAIITDEGETTTFGVTHNPVTGKWGVTVTNTDTVNNETLLSFTYGAWDDRADAQDVYRATVDSYYAQGYLPA